MIPFLMVKYLMGKAHFSSRVPVYCEQLLAFWNTKWTAVCSSREFNNTINNGVKLRIISTLTCELNSAHLPKTFPFYTNKTKIYRYVIYELVLHLACTCVWSYLKHVLKQPVQDKQLLFFFVMLNIGTGQNRGQELSSVVLYTSNISEIDD